MTIVLKRGRNFLILMQLLRNYILLLRLKIHKSIHGINHPIVHYYAVCWNEERILPFMFQHYDKFVDHYTIYDNYSTDQCEAIIRSHHNADIVKFRTDGFNDNEHARIKNSCWKRSRGKADYVVVCDTDEFLYHEDIFAFLQDASRQRYSFFRPEGWEMYSATFPTFEKGIPLTTQVKVGVPSPNYGKSILFDPYRIVEINYEPGAHFCHPLGLVRTLNHSGLKVLHYKNLGLDYMMSRINSYRKRMSDINKEEQYAFHYYYDDQQIAATFHENLNNAVPAI